MMRDEREEYGEEDRDVIEGLRYLARRIETPPDIRPQILARGEQLLPPQQEHRSRWWTVVAAWRPHPLAWGPVVAVVFFIAGVVTPWPRVALPLKDAVVEERSAPVAYRWPKEATEVPPASPTTPPQPLRQESGRRIELPPVASEPLSSEPLSALARHAPRQVAVPSEVKVTATLPAALYEQLQQAAQRRRVSLTAILREAVEAYTRSQTREEGKPARPDP
jgi:ribbon-helix-helix CopG family protein